MQDFVQTGRTVIKGERTLRIVRVLSWMVSKVHLCISKLHFSESETLCAYLPRGQATYNHGRQWILVPESLLKRGKVDKDRR